MPLKDDAKKSEVSGDCLSPSILRNGRSDCTMQGLHCSKSLLQLLGSEISHSTCQVTTFQCEKKNHFFSNDSPDIFSEINESLLDFFLLDVKFPRKL